MGRKPTCLSSVVGKRPKRGIGAGLPREIERTFGLPENWLDQDHSADPLSALPRIVEAVHYLIEEPHSAILELEESLRTTVLSQYFEEAIDDGVSRGTLGRFIKCAK
jgi:hypothetical protein